MAQSNTESTESRNEQSTMPVESCYTHEDYCRSLGIDWNDARQMTLVRALARLIGYQE